MTCNENRPVKTYQDQWLKGKLVAKGTRECASRYELVKSFCEQHYGDRPFSVCDIGANMCYFGLRLTEDFPNCAVLAFEYGHFKMRAAHVKRNDAKRLLLVKYKVHADNLAMLASCGWFDLILVLNVLHHVGDEFDLWLKGLRQLGTHIIAEFATTDSRSKTEAADYRIPSYAKILGYGKSHIKKSVNRPIVLISGDTETSKEAAHIKSISDIERVANVIAGVMQR